MRNKRSLWSLVYAISVLLIITTPSCNWLKEKGIIGKKERRLAELLAQQDSLRKADSIRKVENRLRAIEEARLDSIRLAEEERVLLQSRQRYNIVVGSFLNHDYAVEWLEQYRSHGFDPKIIQMNGTDFELVVAESHEQYSKAIERLDYFLDEIDIFSWLYILK